MFFLSMYVRLYKITPLSASCYRACGVSPKKENVTFDFHSQLLFVSEGDFVTIKFDQSLPYVSQGELLSTSTKSFIASCGGLFFLAENVKHSYTPLSSFVFSVQTQHNTPRKTKRKF